MDDLVAELTLKLRNEMSAGLDEIRQEFGALDGTLGEMNKLLGTLNENLSKLVVPADLASGFVGVDTEVQTVITSIDGIGVAIDGDITKVGELRTAIADIQVPSIAGAAAGSGQASQSSEQAYMDTQGGGKRVEPEHNPVGEFIIASIGAMAGWSGEQSYAKFQETALAGARMEGLEDSAALAEAKNIMHESYNQAYLSRGNVDDIENAYVGLIQQRLPKQIVDQMMGPLSEASTAYNTPIDQLTQPLFNLYEQFKIPGEELNRGIAMLGAATHMGHFYFQDFVPGLPAIASQFELMHDTGFKGEATAAAALEAARRGEPDSAQTVTDMNELLSYMTSPTASRFFDRTQRSKDLLGANIMDIFDKYHIKPLDIPAYFNEERDKGVDPLTAMVDYMHQLGAQGMSPTDEMEVFKSLFHNLSAARAMLALEQNYDDQKDIHGNVMPGFKTMSSSLLKVQPSFLDENFQTAIQGDSGGMQNIDTFVTYLDRLYGQNTFGLLAGNNAPSQANLNAMSPGSNAFNIPITLNVNVDKSGNVTAAGGVTGAPSSMGAPASPGVNVKINQGNVLGAP
jgi:hypothetical protein